MLLSPHTLHSWVMAGTSCPVCRASKTIKNQSPAKEHYNCWEAEAQATPGGVFLYCPETRPLMRDRNSRLDIRKKSAYKEWFSEVLWFSTEIICTKRLWKLHAWKCLQLPWIWSWVSNQNLLVQHGIGLDWASSRAPFQLNFYYVSRKIFKLANETL